MTTALPLPNENVRQQLMKREKDIIAEAQRMQGLVRQRNTYTMAPYRSMIAEAKKRLAALQAGLAPVRIAGRWFSLERLLQAGHPLPSQIVQVAEQAAERFPGIQTRVYGWEEESTPAERRRRDPVLVGAYGGDQYFLGFWLEVETHYEEMIPQFIGMASPLLPKLGRGRPRKALKGA